MAKPLVSTLWGYNTVLLIDMLFSSEQDFCLCLDINSGHGISVWTKHAKGIA